MRNKIIAVALLLQVFTVHAKFMPQAPLSAFLNVAEAHQLKPELLYALALKESGRSIDKRYQPHPYAIGIGYDPIVQHLGHHSMYPDSYEEAVTILNQLIDAGFTNIGIGLMQINWGANHTMIDDPILLLDPQYNLHMASKVLNYCQRYDEQLDVLACYRSGSNTSELGQTYAQSVIALQAQYGDLFHTRYMPSGRLSLEQLIEYQHHRDAEMKETP